MFRVWLLQPSIAVSPLADFSPVYEQRRVDLATFRAVPASTSGHCPQVLLFTVVWDIPGKEKIPNGLLPPPAF